MKNYDTNINNINYNNYDNYDNDMNYVITTAKDITSDISRGEQVTSSFGLASPDRLPVFSETLVSSVTPPANWRGVKFDLFDNQGKLKLKLNIIKFDGSTQHLTAGLNSPRSHVFRNKAKTGNQLHWNMVKRLLQDRGKDYRISKVYPTGRKSSVVNLVVGLHRQQQDWAVDMIHQHKFYSFVLRDEISLAFKNKNGIASGYFGHNDWGVITCEELGI